MKRAEKESQWFTCGRTGFSVPARSGTTPHADASSPNEAARFH